MLASNIRYREIGIVDGLTREWPRGFAQVYCAAVPEGGGAEVHDKLLWIVADWRHEGTMALMARHTTSQWASM
jgi:hypothetical protein